MKTTKQLMKESQDSGYEPEPWETPYQGPAYNPIRLIPPDDHSQDWDSYEEYIPQFYPNPNPHGPYWWSPWVLGKGGQWEWNDPWSGVISDLYGDWYI